VPIVKVNSQSQMKIFFVLATLILIALSAGAVVGQSFPSPLPSPSPPPKPVDGRAKSDDTPLSTYEEEMRAKREIKLAEKDHEENLKRAREIAEIGKELKISLKDKSTVDRDCLKKIERLEKLTKKVRGEAGGEDEEITIPNRPSDLDSAITQIAEASENLSKRVQETPRRVVSAAVISNANVLLELIKMARAFARPQP
jgi:hypothetical protein